jgi:hypothetical protein
MSPTEMLRRLERATDTHDLDGLVDCFAAEYVNGPRCTPPGASAATNRYAGTGPRSSPGYPT